MKVLFALVALALTAATSLAQCQAACPAPQAQVQYAPQVVQAQAVAVPSFLFVVPSAPQVQLNVQPQYIPQAAPLVVQAAPVVVQRQVVVQKQIVQKAPVVVQRAPVQRQRSFSFQRTVIR